MKNKNKIEYHVIKLTKLMLDVIPIELILQIFSHINNVQSMSKLMRAVKLFNSEKNKNVFMTIIDNTFTKPLISKLKEKSKSNKISLRRDTLYSIIGFCPAEKVSKISKKILQDTIQTKYNPELIRIHCINMKSDEKDITMKYITTMLHDNASRVLTRIECLKMLKQYNAFQHINDIFQFIDNKSLNIHDYNLISPVAMDALSYLSNKYNIQKLYYKDKINSLFKIKNKNKQSPQFLVGILISLFNYNCHESLLFKQIVNFIDQHYPYHHVYHPNIITSNKLIKAYDKQSDTSVMGGPYPLEPIETYPIILY
jgi:ribosomal protein L19